jgi:hypothetical protein
MKMQAENEASPALGSIGESLPAEEAEALEAHPAHAWRNLEIRKEILSRIFEVRKNEGTLLQHEASCEEIVLRLGEDTERKEGDADGLPPDRRKHLEGRLLEGQARAELCLEMKAQYKKEIAFFRARISRTKNDTGAWVTFRRWLSLLLWT